MPQVTFYCSKCKKNLPYYQFLDVKEGKACSRFMKTCSLHRKQKCDVIETLRQNKKILGDKWIKPNLIEHIKKNTKIESESNNAVEVEPAALDIEPEVESEDDCDYDCEAPELVVQPPDDKVNTEVKTENKRNNQVPNEAVPVKRKPRIYPDLNAMETRLNARLQQIENNMIGNVKGVVPKTAKKPRGNPDPKPNQIKREEKLALKLPPPKKNVKAVKQEVESQPKPQQDMMSAYRRMLGFN